MEPSRPDELRDAVCSHSFLEGKTSLITLFTKTWGELRMGLTGCEAVDGRADDGVLHTRSRIEPHPHRPHVSYGGSVKDP
jgi:hypothetical protein